MLIANHFNCISILRYTLIGRLYYYSIEYTVCTTHISHHSKYLIEFDVLSSKLYNIQLERLYLIAPILSQSYLKPLYLEVLRTYRILFLIFLEQNLRRLRN